MVDVYASESEQVEQLKKIWREYGIAIVIGIVLALAATLVWRIYHHRQEHMLEHASMRYEQLLTNVVNGNITDVQTEANRLMDRYPKTPYASLAALQLARQDIYIGNLEDAQDKLSWVYKKGSSTNLREIARIRLARVLIAKKEPQQAFDLLNNNSNSIYAAAAWEIKGDALLALGKTDEAREAYRNALRSSPGIEAIRPLIQMKLDDLSTTKNATASSSINTENSDQTG